MYAYGISPGWLKVSPLIFYVVPSQMLTPPLPCRSLSHSCLAQQTAHLAAFQMGYFLPQSASLRSASTISLSPEVWAPFGQP